MCKQINLLTSAFPELKDEQAMLSACIMTTIQYLFKIGVIMRKRTKRYKKGMLLT